MWRSAAFEVVRPPPFLAAVVRLASLFVVAAAAVSVAAALAGFPAFPVAVVVVAAAAAALKSWGFGCGSLSATSGDDSSLPARVGRFGSGDPGTFGLASVLPAFATL